MTIYHNHHIIPKHIGGSNDSSNIKKLTIRQHALAHKKLFEEHGRWQDKEAWLSLSGQITCAEAIKRAQILSNKTRIISDETKIKMSLSHKGKPSAMKGKHHTQKSKEMISLAKKGKQQKESTKKLWSINRTKKFKEGIMFVPTFTGRKHSENHKHKMSLLMSGRKLSEETKLKISLAKRKKAQHVNQSIL